MKSLQRYKCALGRALEMMVPSENVSQSENATGGTLYTKIQWIRMPLLTHELCNGGQFLQMKILFS